MIYKLQNPSPAAFLFKNWHETIIWSCLQGVMGHIFADSAENPTCAMAILGDFCFVAGAPKSELILFKPAFSQRNFIIMVPHSEHWAKLIEDSFCAKAKKVTRYATKKEPNIFDIPKLRAAVQSLPAQYTMKMIDRELFGYCKKTGWCRDFVSQYESYEAYKKHGLGVIISSGDEPVCGASSYSGYRGGIEIEIDTRKDFRRQGLAYICGAKLILECLGRGIYPSWDAQNKASLALAKKLGYNFSREYPAYEINL